MLKKTVEAEIMMYIVFKNKQTQDNSIECHMLHLCRLQVCGQQCVIHVF